ncbi:uncharacterized protein A4U43_C03F15130 [Asparagus officinalis]|uniref:Uncharacterized protein n=1 Tax=Asparagus officinalis TaxID=4686 RepID=A0A5P1FF60_ASPOF|nr:uncharacterized protein A4U43_C03F15130 [Asparagus officinalis]
MAEATEKKRIEETPPRHRGWKAMPYIIGNETFEKLGTLGTSSNLLVYLTSVFHLKSATAATFLNVLNGTTNIAPLVGAFLSDSYFGRYFTLGFASVASFMGMIVLTMTASIRQLQPPSCTPEQLKSETCPGASKAQVGVLILSLILLAIGAGGVRPCSLPFGVDQFDRTTEQGRQGLNSFFNWYYCTSTAGVIVAMTLMVYIQSSVSWPLGFGIPTGLMLLALIFFFLGTRVYTYVPPEGSVFSGTAQVFVAAFRKRSLRLPSPDDVQEQESLLYNSAPKSDRILKLPLTLQFRCLNKAAIKREGELKEDGSVANPWRLSTVQQIEEVKCLLRIVPIWASGIVCFVALAQQWTFSVLQGVTMDRHIGSHFQIPAASLGTLSLVALVLFIPIYDQLLVPIARRITGIESGITLLQRQGTGLVISALSMIVAGLVEQKRRNSALAHGGMTPMSAFWLSPQLILMGVAEAFNAVGQIEFYNRQFPEHLQTLAGSLFYCSLAGSNYLSSILVSIVQKNTNWLNNNDLNHGRIDYFYYVIAAMGAVNFAYFVVCAYFYRYKGVPEIKEEAINEKTSKEMKDFQNV